MQFYCIVFLFFCSHWSRFWSRYWDGEVFQHQVSLFWPQASCCGSGCHGSSTKDAWRWTQGMFNSSFNCIKYQTQPKKKINPEWTFEFSQIYAFVKQKKIHKLRLNVWIVQTVTANNTVHFWTHCSHLHFVSHFSCVLILYICNA